MAVLKSRKGLRKKNHFKKIYVFLNKNIVIQKIKLSKKCQIISKNALCDFYNNLLIT
jgi:hypothetical protein